jgi:hypothetical protein
MEQGEKPYYEVCCTDAKSYKINPADYAKQIGMLICKGFSRTVEKFYLEITGSIPKDDPYQRNKKFFKIKRP